MSPLGGSLRTSDNVSAVELYCGISGVPLPDVQWFGPSGAGPLTSGPKYSIMHTLDFSVLYIIDYNVTTDDGQYYCQVDNAAGTQTCSVTLSSCNCVIGEWSEVSIAEIYMHRIMLLTVKCLSQ